MSTNGVIISAIVCAVLFAVLQIMARQKARFDQQRGTTILEHHLMMKICAVLIAFILPPGILLFSIYSPVLSKLSPWIVITIATLILAIGLLLYIEATYLRIFITPSKISVKTPWRRNLTIHWQDVQYVEYSPTFMWFIIKSHKGERINVYLHLRGIKDFVKQTKLYLKEDQLKDAEKGFKAIGK